MDHVVCARSSTTGQSNVQPISLDDLLSMPEMQLARFDVAGLNLDCAVGLPGAEDLEIGKCLSQFDEWADRVRESTENRRSNFATCPEYYDNSEAVFRMVILVLTLQQDCGVRYNPDRIHDPDFTNSQDLFVHGLFTGRGGTCASMPVLYAAIARRLGYPLRLVHAKSHVFVRWDDPLGLSGYAPARVNIEGATIGMDTYADEYYETWPMTITKREIEARQFLHSLAPREEVAAFLALRGNCLQDHGRFQEATRAYSYACQLAPHIEVYALWNDVSLLLDGFPVPPGPRGQYVAEIARVERERESGLLRFGSHAISERS
jgi:hypothetical protein